MSTSWQVRREPCANCGEKVVMIETRLSGLGGLWRRTEPTRVEHADFVPRPGRVDRIDDGCSRPRSLADDASSVRSPTDPG